MQAIDNFKKMLLLVLNKSRFFVPVQHHMFFSRNEDYIIKLNTY